MDNILVPNDNELLQKIYTFRGVKVMLDRDLAVLYDVKSIRLREQVKRNIKRFPKDFMFQLNEDEVETLLSQNAIPSRKQLGGAMPYVFTEQGIAGISGVLTSDRAIEVNIAIMRTFVNMRRYLAENSGLLQRIDSLEKRQIACEITTDKRFNQGQAPVPALILMVFKPVPLGNQGTHRGGCPYGLVEIVVDNMVTLLPMIGAI